MRISQSSTDIETSWLQSYYEALQFFYWEPQHLGRKKHANAEFNTLEKVAKHLGQIEVTLNHNLSQFFHLAPSRFRHRLFNRLFGVSFESNFILHGRDVDTTFELGNSMQPDLMFTSDEALISIEMKVGAKSSVSQVLKYALLGLAVELRADAPRRHFLAFLGRGTFADQWQERFQTVQALQAATAIADQRAFLEKCPLRFHAHGDRFSAIVSELVMSFMSYAEFASTLRNELPLPTDTSEGGEVYARLLNGVLQELKRRGLAA